MKYLVSGFIGIMVSAIILYQVFLPSLNNAIYTGNTTPTTAGAGNITGANLLLSNQIQTLAVVALILGIIGMAFYAFE